MNFNQFVGKNFVVLIISLVLQLMVLIDAAKGYSNSSLVSKRHVFSGLSVFQPVIDVTVDGNPFGDNAVYDFGNVTIGDGGQVTFEVRNSGDQDLALSVSISGDSDFSISSPVGTPISPGNSGVLIIDFNPVCGFELRNALVEITTNDPSLPIFTINLEGSAIDVVPPPLSCPGDVIFFLPAETCVANVPGIEAVTEPDDCSTTFLSYSLTGATETSGPGNVNVPLNVGETIVQYFYHDGRNLVNCFFAVNVRDTIPPQVSCPSNKTVILTPDNCDGMVEDIEPVVSDNCGNFETSWVLSGATSGSGQGSASGQSFNKGITTVAYSVIDESNNQSQCSFEVEVRDADQPVFTSCPPNVVINLPPGKCDSLFSYTPPVAMDGCNGLITSVLVSGLASGSSFPVGINTVVYSAININGVEATCSFDVSVISPFLQIENCPEDISVLDPFVTYQLPEPSATCSDLTIELIEGIPSGNVFPLGETDIAYSISDPFGNSIVCDFTVTVESGSIFVPNLFSPNDDGINDFFHVNGKGIMNFSLVVYDSNSRELFRTTDPQAEGWDGTYLNEPLPEGIYIWVIDGAFKSGKPLTYEGKNMGSIALVR